MPPAEQLGSLLAPSAEELVDERLQLLSTSSRRRSS
jgi:hypothetical protein